VTIRLWRAGETGEGKETLAWGAASGGPPPALDSELQLETETIADSFKSDDPNKERVARDMPLTVETPDGKGGKTTKKVRVKK
jgi:hypothetical protein